METEITIIEEDHKEKWGETCQKFWKSLGFTSDGEIKDPIIDAGNFDDCVVPSEAKKIAPPSEPAQESKLNNDDSSTGNDISQPAQIIKEEKIMIDEDKKKQAASAKAEDEKEPTKDHKFGNSDEIYYTKPISQRVYKHNAEVRALKQAETPPEDNSNEDEMPDFFSYTGDNIPNCPTNLRLNPDYKLDKFGIWRKKKMIGKNAGKENKYYNELISYTPMVITQRLIDVDTSEHYFEISWYDLNTDKWNGGIIVPAADIANTTKCCEALAKHGLSIVQSKAKYVSEYLDALANNAYNRTVIPIKKLFNLPGWIDDDCSQFLYPTDNFAETDNILKIASKSYVSKFKAHGDFDVWKQAIIKLYEQDSPIFRVVFATALAAPLIKVLSVRNLQVHLWCKTGSGKSAVAKAAMSIYGNPDKLKMTFNATKKSIDELSATFNDLAAWVDELQLADPSFFKDNKDSPIYNFAEGAYRKRLNQRGDLTKKSMELPPIRGTRITTGEMPILSDNSNAGAYNRVLQISEQKIFDDDINISAIHKFFGENYGHFGRIWIDWIQRHISYISGIYNQNLQTFDKYAAEQDFMSADNWSVFFAITCTALQLAMPKIGNFSYQSVFEKFCAGLKTIVKDVPKKDTAQNWQRAISGLQDYIAAHPRRFLYEVQSQEGVATYLGYPTGMLPDNVVHGAILRDKTVAFYPAELRNIIERELKFPSAKSIIRDFADNAILELPKKETPKRPYQKSLRLTVGDSPKWYYIFKAGTLIENDAQDQPDPLD